MVVVQQQCSALGGQDVAVVAFNCSVCLVWLQSPLLNMVFLGNKCPSQPAYICIYVHEV